VGPTLSRRPLQLGRLGGVLLAAVVAVALFGRFASDSFGADRPIRILTGAAATLDPARAGDASSAGVIAQVFESLTAFDATLTVRPALARSWDVEDGGRRIVFHLRDGLTFSDGTELGGADVLRSWLRLLDPVQPSPLVSLMFDVEGALDFVRGRSNDPATVGLEADGLDVTVRLTRPAADFVNVVAGPSFAIVPPGIDAGPAALTPGSSFVASGGYTISAATPGSTSLRSNARYWAGTPPTTEIELVHDLGGRSGVQAYEAGDIDYAPIGDFDASWIAYDQALGPDLREVPSLSVQYYGFDTTRAPFDDVRVRQAFGAAVNWRRIVELGSTGSEVSATSMVPAGIPGRSEADFLPAHDPDTARNLLAEAGFPDGAGFPTVQMLTGGGQYDEAIVTELERELGVAIVYETMDFGTYFDRLETDPPQLWSLSWVADYPGPNDFLGVLLGSEASNNYGGYTSTEFDAAIRDAGAATDEATARAAYDRAEQVVQRDVPVVPISYGTGWALSRAGLLGAEQNGLGSIRMAGLTWAD
jgi:ABC-type transport system substrate-binding protein